MITFCLIVSFMQGLGFIAAATSHGPNDNTAQGAKFIVACAGVFICIVSLLSNMKLYGLIFQ